MKKIIAILTALVVLFSTCTVQAAEINTVDYKIIHGVRVTYYNSPNLAHINYFAMPIADNDPGYRGTNVSKEIQLKLMPLCKFYKLDIRMVLSLIDLTSKGRWNYSVSEGNFYNRYGTMAVLEENVDQMLKGIYGDKYKTYEAVNLDLGCYLLAEALDAGKGIEYALTAYLYGYRKAEANWKSGDIEDVVYKIRKHALKIESLPLPVEGSPFSLGN